MISWIAQAGAVRTIGIAIAASVPVALSGGTGKIGDVTAPGVMESAPSTTKTVDWLNGRFGGSLIEAGSTDAAIAAARRALDGEIDRSQRVRAIGTASGVGFVSVGEREDAFGAATTAQTGLAAAVRLIEDGGGPLAIQWETLEQRAGFDAPMRSDDRRLADVVGGTVRGGVTVALISDGETSRAVYASTPATQGTIRRGPNGVIVAASAEIGLDWLKHEAMTGSMGENGSRVIASLDGEIVWVGYARRSIVVDAGAAVRQRVRQQAEDGARIAAFDNLRKLVSEGSSAPEAVTDASGDTRSVFTGLGEIARRATRLVSQRQPDTTTLDSYDGTAAVAFRVWRLDGTAFNREVADACDAARPLGSRARLDGRGLTIGEDGLATRR